MKARPKKKTPAKGAETKAAPARAPLGSPAWLPAIAVAMGGLVLLAFQFFVHRTPLYGVETDLLGDLIPAARALRAGHVAAANFEFKGPGYPLLLAAAGGVLGDDWIAARVLNVIGAGVGAWFAGRIAARFLGERAGLFVLCGLFLNPTWALAAVEAGTDMPAFALSMVATDWTLRARGPLAWATAGLLAAAAILTRYNAMALAPAALVTWFARRGGNETGAVSGEGTRRPAWIASLAPYLAGLALPLLVWGIGGRIAAGEALRNRNYLNVAFEIYGRGGTWDAFWLDAGQRFHSMADVLLLDPLRVARVLGRSAALRWWDDVRQLVPIWIGVPALLGMVLAWPRRKDAIPVAAHFGFAYLVLTTVFYNTRFFLFLVPFYLMGAAALLFAPAGLPWGAARGRARTIPLALGTTAAVILLGTSAMSLRTEARARLRDEPFEVRVAAETLRRIDPDGGRIMARKPHIAFFAGMAFEPLPQVDTFLDLFAAARETRTDYLFYSGLEAHLRDQFWLLDVPGMTLPGLEKIEERTLTPYRYYTLYRFTSAISDSAAFADTLLRTVTELARANPNDERAQSQVGGLLVGMGRPFEAIAPLTAAVRRSPGNLRAQAWLARALFETGDIEGAARTCELLSAAAEPPAGTHRLLARIRLAQGRMPEARAALERAVRLEPVNPAAAFELAMVEQALGDPRSAETAFARGAALAPERAPAMREVLSAIPSGAPPETLLTRLRRGAS